MIKIISVLFTAAFSCYAFAQVPSFPTSSGGGSGVGSGTGFFGSIAIKGGLGTASDGNEEVVESRGLFHYGAEATLGLRWGSLAVGGSVDYIFWEQREDADKVDNTDMSGTQLALSPTIGYSLGPFLLQAKVPFSSKVTLKQQDAGGNDVVYTDAKFPAFSAQVKYRLGGSTFIGLEYTKTTYKTMEVDGEKTKLDSNTQVTYSAWGLVYGILF